MVEPFTVLIGRSFSSAMVWGELFVSTSYSKEPILAVPEGTIKFWLLTAFTTSTGERPFDWSAVMLRSTMTFRCFPPYGYGMAVPGTLMRPTRIKFCPMSESCCSVASGADRPSCKIGTEEALYVMTKGGVIPGGKFHPVLWLIAVT